MNCDKHPECSILGNLEGLHLPYAYDKRLTYPNHRISKLFIIHKQGVEKLRSLDKTDCVTSGHVRSEVV